MPESDSTGKLPRLLARETVYQRLREWIVEGTLAPNEALRDHDLAEKLGVSRTPVREALRRLEDEGFIITALNRWTKVAPLNEHEARHLHPIVCTLEVLALETIPTEEIPWIVAALRARNDTLRHAIEGAGRPQPILEADNAFHNTLIEASANPAIADVLLPIKVRLRRYELAYFSRYAPHINSVAEHAAIIAGLDSGNLVAAQAALAANWLNPLRLIAH